MNPTHTPRAGHGALGALLLASCALLVAACGGSSSTPGVAHLASSTAAASKTSTGAGASSSEGRPSQQQMVAFSKCMRAHGLPEFPEPSEGHLLVRSRDNNRHVGGPNPGSAQFQAAQKACGKLLPNGGLPSPAVQAKVREQALKFSECMRTHGVPNFPDPKFTGNAVSLRLGKTGASNPNSPQFQAAQKACQSLGPKVPDAKGGPAEGGFATSGGPKGGGE